MNRIEAKVPPIRGELAREIRDVARDSPVLLRGIKVRAEATACSSRVT